MAISRILALSGALVVISTTALSSTPELSRYRQFQLGMSVGTVARQAAITSEARVVHRRPELLQELMWLPPRSASPSQGDSVRKVLFNFYSDQLFRIVVTYDRERTEGLTVEDMVEVVSATYGPATLPGTGVAPLLSHAPQGSDKIVAQWEDPQYSVTLFRSSYLSTFGLVVLSKRLDRLAEVATIEAILMDEQQAPQREIERQQKQTVDDRVKEETVRRVNKAAFRL
jgi:hypothetical protein